MMLSKENYQKGFLIDEEWMGGVSLDSQSGVATAFVLNHLQAETLFSETYTSLEAALAAINSVNRPTWKFESSNGCESKDCGNGNCKGESCKAFSECGGTRC